MPDKTAGVPRLRQNRVNSKRGYPEMGGDTSFCTRFLHRKFAAKSGLWCADQNRQELGGESPHGEGAAIHIGPEPCVGTRKGISEASVGQVPPALAPEDPVQMETAWV